MIYWLRERIPEDLDKIQYTLKQAGPASETSQLLYRILSLFEKWNAKSVYILLFSYYLVDYVKICDIIDFGILKYPLTNLQKLGGLYVVMQ